MTSLCLRAVTFARSLNRRSHDILHYRRSDDDRRPDRGDKQAAQAAAPQNLVSAESSDQYDEGSHIECPVCGGEGSVQREAEYLNYDGTAIGVQFYGIGNAPGLPKRIFARPTPPQCSR